MRPGALESLGEDGSRFEVDGFPPVHLRLVGVHQVANALAALAVARELKLDPRRRWWRRSRPTGRRRGRMELRHERGATLLVDCYNANPDATRAGARRRWPAGRARNGASRCSATCWSWASARRALHRETGAAVRGAELWAVGEHADDYAAGARAAGAKVRVLASIEEARDGAARGAGAGT